MKRAVLFILLAALPALTQQSPAPATPAPTAKAAAEAKLPDVKPETKLVLRDADVEWLAANARISAIKDQFQKDLAEAQAQEQAVEKHFKEVYDAATAEGKKAGVDTDKYELAVPVGDSAGIKFVPKTEQAAPHGR